MDHRTPTLTASKFRSTTTQKHNNHDNEDMRRIKRMHRLGQQ